MLRCGVPDGVCMRLAMPRDTPRTSLASRNTPVLKIESTMVVRAKPASPSGPGLPSFVGGAAGGAPGRALTASSSALNCSAVNNMGAAVSCCAAGLEGLGRPAARDRSASTSTASSGCPTPTPPHSIDTWASSAMLHACGCRCNFNSAQTAENCSASCASTSHGRKARDTGEGKALLVGCWQHSARR